MILDNYREEDSGRKIVYDEIQLKFLDRFKIWKKNVINAIYEKPPKTRTIAVEVFPDDPRFNAPFTCSIINQIWSVDLKRCEKNT